jgi:cytochrome b
MTTETRSPPAVKAVRVWDGPTRLLHWALAILFAISWYTAENTLMELHRWSGYAVIGLLVFRLYWGLVGSSTARFAGFVKGPKAIFGYLRGLSGAAGAPAIGHNPLGALSVIALLALLAVQTGLGLFAVDVDGIESGPLSYLVSFDVGRAAARAHHLVFNILLALVVLHIAAIAFYLIAKRDNLIGPMITGRKAIAAPGARFAPLWLIAPGLILAGALVYGVMNGFRF